MADTFRILAEVLVQLQGQEALKPLAKSIDDVTKKNKDLVAAQTALKTQIAATGDVAAKGVLEKALQKVESQIKANTKAAKEFAGETSRLEQVGQKLPNIFSFAAGTVLANAFTAAGSAAVEFGKNIVDAGGRFEQYKIQLNTLFQSADKGKVVFENLQKAATETPFAFSELVELTARLAAYGVQDFEIIPTIETLGNIAAGVGKEKLPQLVLAFGQVKAASKLTGNELRQFTEAGVPLLDLLGKTLNKTVAEVKATIESGKVSFKDVEAALQSTTKAGGQFFDLMRKQSQTTLGAFSNLGDAIEQLQAAIGASTNGIIKDATIALTDLVNATKQLFAGDAVQNIENERNSLNGLVATIGAVSDSTLSLNEQNKIRSGLIADLRSQYPSFLGNLKDEEITTQNLAILLETNNRLYAEKLRIARQDIIVGDANKKLADAEKQLSQRLIDVNTLLSDANARLGLDLQVSSAKDLDKAIEKLSEVRNAGNLTSENAQKITSTIFKLGDLRSGGFFGLIGEDFESLQGNINDAEKNLNALLKTQSKASIDSKKELQSELSRINNEIRLENQVLANAIDKDDKAEITAKINALKVAKAQVEKALKGDERPAPAKTVPTADPDAAKKAAQEAKKIADAQKDAAKRLQAELLQLQNETAQIQNKGNAESAERIRQQNKLEADAAKQRIAELRKELAEKKAITPELSKLFSQVELAIDTKFTVKGDIEIEELNKKLEKLKTQIERELASLERESRTAAIKVGLLLQVDESPEGFANRLASELLIIENDTQNKLTQSRIDFAAKREQIAESEALGVTEKEKAITRIIEAEAETQKAIVLEGEVEKEKARVNSLERTAELQLKAAELGVDITKEETQRLLSELNQRYLDNLVTLEQYEKQKAEIQRTANLSEINAEIIAAEQRAAIVERQIDELKKLKETSSVEPIDDAAIAKLSEELDALRAKIRELGNEKVEAKVDIKVNTETDIDKLQKVIKDPISAAINAVMPGIGDEATAAVKDALTTAFEFGNEIAKEAQEQKMERIDNEIKALQESIDFQLKLKDVNTERIEAERRQIDALTARKEQAARRAEIAQKAERISTLALAVANAILAINKTAAESAVLAPIVIPLVVGAMLLGIAAAAAPAISGSAQDGDVDIAQGGNRRKRGKDDTLLYNVAPGESVITKRGTRLNKPLLERINKGEHFHVVGNTAIPQMAMADTRTVSENYNYVTNRSVIGVATGQDVAKQIAYQVDVKMKPLVNQLRQNNEEQINLLMQIGRINNQQLNELQKNNQANIKK